MDPNEVDQVDQMGQNEDRAAGLVGRVDLRQARDQDLHRANRPKGCFLPSDP